MIGAGDTGKGLIGTAGLWVSLATPVLFSGAEPLTCDSNCNWTAEVCEETTDEAEPPRKSSTRELSNNDSTPVYDLTTEGEGG